MTSFTDEYLYTTNRFTSYLGWCSIENDDWVGAHRYNNDANRGHLPCIYDICIRRRENQKETSKGDTFLLNLLYKVFRCSQRGTCNFDDSDFDDDFNFDNELEKVSDDDFEEDFEDNLENKSEDDSDDDYYYVSQ